jgi:hypothetical protein
MMINRMDLGFNSLMMRGHDANPWSSSSPLGAEELKPRSWKIRELPR